MIRQTSRTIAALVAVFLCVNVFAALTTDPYGYDFESPLKRNTSSNINGVWLTSIYNTATGSNACQQIKVDNASSITRRSTDYALSGSYSMRLGLRYACSYVQFNSGLVKPRTGIIFNNEDAFLDSGTEYWVGMANYFPENWIFDYEDNPDNVMQFKKLDNTGTLGKTFVSWLLRDDKLQFELRHDGTSSAQNMYSKNYDVTLGEWNKIVMHFIPCRSNTGGACGSNGVNGFFRVYVNSTSTSGLIKNVTGITKANPAVVTIPSHGLSTGDYIVLQNVGGMTQANNKEYQVTVVNSNSVSLNSTNSTGWGTYTSGGKSIEAWVDKSGINTAGTKHDFDINYYKYNWHATKPGPGHSGSGDARADVEWAMNCSSGSDLNSSSVKCNGSGYPRPRHHTRDSAANSERAFYADDVFVGTSFSGVAPNFLEDPLTVPGSLEITKTNTGNSITADTSPIFYTTAGGDSTGVTRITFTDANNVTVPALGSISNSSGGRYATGSMAGLVSGDATMNVYYDNANLVFNSEVDHIDDWVDPLNVTITPTASSWGSTGAAILENSGASQGYVQDTVIAFTSGDRITIIDTVAEGTSDRYRLRVRRGGNDIIFQGVIGSMISEEVEHGDNLEFTQTQVGDVWFLRLDFDATETGNYEISAAVGENGIGNNIIFERRLVWENLDENLLTFPVQLTLEDDTAPVLISCDLSQRFDGALLAGCLSTDDTGTLYVSLNSLDTAPTSSQVKAGLDSNGDPALYAGSLNYITGDEFFTISNTDPYVDRHAYFLQTNESGLDSVVVGADECIEAETEVLKSIIFDGTLKRFGSGYSGTVDHFKVYSSNPLVGTANELAHAEDVVITDGSASIDEDDLSSGSINQLLESTDYWFFFFDEDKDPFSFGEIQITTSE